MNNLASKGLTKTFLLLEWATPEERDWDDTAVLYPWW